ncbi:MAG: VanW family protein [Chloroflexota bacterium]
MARTASLPLGISPSPLTGAPMRRMGFTFGVTLLAVAIFGAAFAVGYARVNEGRILPGVDIGGVSVSGLDENSAAAKLDTALPDLSTGQLVIDLGNSSQSVPFSLIGRRYDVPFMIDEAMGVGRATNFIEQLQEQIRVLVNGVSVSPAATWDNAKLVHNVAAIAMAAQRDPISASLSRVDGRYVVNPSDAGVSVDVQGAVASALAAVDNVSADDAHISVATTVVPPAIETSVAQEAADTAERVMGTDVQISGPALTMTLASSSLRGWVHLDPKPDGTGWQLVIERAPIAQAVADYALTTDIAPTNASFAFKEGEIKVVPSANGTAIDVETTTSSIMSILGDRAAGSLAGAATLTLNSVAPTFTTAAATAIAPKVKMLGTWTTNYVSSPLNGLGVNIQIPTSIIDGYVVEPGGLFDYLSVIGPITSPPYTQGAAIVNGHTHLDGVLGGGMCSSSTTLFNAALRAGLQMKNRGNHFYYISRYPLGLDATVWISRARRLTMSFYNDTAYPLLIRGINEQGKVTFQVWGVDDGRTVELSDPVVENPVAAIDQVQYTDTLAAGAKKRIEFNTDGMDVTVTRTVKDAAGNVIHFDTFHSSYGTVNGITQVGRYPGDPPEGTTIPATQYNH